MSVEVADVAAALVGFLDAQTFSAPYEKIRPERLYDPEFTPGQLAGLKVSVCGVDVEEEPETREAEGCDVMLWVCVQKHTTGSVPEMDALCKLAREVKRACRKAELTVGDVSVFASKADFDPVMYHPGKLHEDSVFWCGVLVTLHYMEES